MTKLFTILAIMSAIGCQSTSQKTKKCEAAKPSVEVEVTRTWTLYSRDCTFENIYTGCSDWNTEAIPDVQEVSPIQANLGNWSCHTLGIQHVEGGWNQVTLWCSTEGHEDQAWQVTTLCQGDDAQESITLTDRETNKYYELTMLCSIN